MPAVANGLLSMQAGKQNLTSPFAPRRPHPDPGPFFFPVPPAGRFLSARSRTRLPPATFPQCSFSQARRGTKKPRSRSRRSSPGPLRFSRSEVTGASTGGLDAMVEQFPEGVSARPGRGGFRFAVPAGDGRAGDPTFPVGGSIPARRCALAVEFLKPSPAARASRLPRAARRYSCPAGRIRTALSA